MRLLARPGRRSRSQSSFESLVRPAACPSVTARPPTLRTSRSSSPQRCAMCPDIASLPCASWSTGPMVSRTSPLNARQVEVLRWIGEGCPDGVMTDFTYKTTAVALQGRGLVTVSRKGGGWQAALTEVGTRYLKHGDSPAETSAPDQPSARPLGGTKDHGAKARSSATGSGRSARPSVRATRTPVIDRQAEDLVRRVIRAGGALELDLEDDETDYKALFADTEEVTGSIPVPPTSSDGSAPTAAQPTALRSLGPRVAIRRFHWLRRRTSHGHTSG
jgi:hypothetical protein